MYYLENSEDEKVLYQKILNLHILLKCANFTVYRFKKSKKVVIESLLFKVSIWLGPITMVTVHNVTMVMYTCHFRCVDPVLLIHKSN